MSKEKYNQIIDDVYEDYLNNFVAPVCPPTLDVQPDFDEPLSKETFIKLIKHSRGFSEKWGLKIEERELSLDERMQLWQNQQDGRGYFIMELLDNIPTKQITLTCNNETIEVYE